MGGYYGYTEPDFERTRPKDDRFGEKEVASMVSDLYGRSSCRWGPSCGLFGMKCCTACKKPMKTMYAPGGQVYYCSEHVAGSDMRVNNGHKLTCAGARGMVNGICQDCLQDVDGPPTVSGSGLTKRGLREGVRVITATPYKPSVRVKPHINNLLSDAYHVLAEELRLLREKAESGMELTDRESRKLNKHIESLTRLAREEREQESRNDPSKLADEELLRLAEKARTVLTGEGDSNGRGSDTPGQEE